MKEKPRRKFVGTGLKIVILIVILAVAAFVGLNEFYINILWFREVGYLQVFLKSLTTQLTMGVPLFLVLFLILSVYYKLLTRSGGKTNLVEAEGSKKRFVRGKLPYLLSAGVSLFSSILITSDLWYKWLEFRNSVPFNEADPIFGRDVSFYVFRLPFYQGLLSVGYTLLFILAASTVLYSFLVIAVKNREVKQIDLQGIQVKGFFSQLWSTFRVQLSIFAAVFFVMLAMSMYLKRFTYLYDASGIVYGATYTDAHILIPFYLIMAGLCLLAALSTLYFGLTKKIKPFLITAAVLIVVNLGGVLVGGIVQNYVVSPNEYSKESEYIGYHIENTQKAYNINDVEVKEYDVQEDITSADIMNNLTTINNIPVNDYLPAIDTYNSIQGIRPYYQFTDVDVDRYYLNGTYTEVFISAREMNNSLLDSSAQTWINLHLKYTHGFGVVVSPVNAVTATGQPVLISQDIPAKTSYPNLSVDQERIYFGEMTDTYAVVNTKTNEFDYPSGDDNMENQYEGTAGIPLTFFNRISFSMSNATLKFLLSSDVTNDSKIIINRNVMQRVEKIAPFLTYDDDPYLVSADGKLYWIIDALTTTDKYPYSEPTSDGYNYIRNSVKIVIDAYNGDVTYYLVDPTDPIAASYAKIYPDLFRSFDEMPTEIKAHLRYSEDLFSVQAQMYATYHMSNTTVFYNKEDVWNIATQYYQTSNQASSVNPTYLIMKLPDRQEEFLLIIPYTPQNKDNMVGWMAGVCDGDDYGKLIVYKFGKSNLVYGPMQIEQRIDQDTTISPQLTLLSQQGSTVLRGNLMTIPIGDSILYIEPIYVKSSGSDSSIPEAKKVIVGYADKLVMSDTIDEALSQIFNLDEGSTTGSASGGSGSSGSSSDGTAAELSAQALDLYNKAIAASSAGDWTNYGIYLQQLGDVLAQLQALQ
ncbi:MAG: UPF0182 family protein [Anaerofustis sp.]